MFNDTSAVSGAERDDYSDTTKYMWEESRLECLYDVKDFIQGPYIAETADFLAENFTFSSKDRCDSFKNFVEAGLCKIRLECLPCTEGWEKTTVSDKKALELLPVINAKIREEIMHIIDYYHGLQDHPIHPHH